MRQINNTSWSPMPMPEVMLLVFVTIFIECGLIALYAKKRGYYYYSLHYYKEIMYLCAIVLLANLITGLISLLYGAYVL